MIAYMLMLSLKFVVFILVIGVLVLVHEFGHFIVAKACGVGVLKFAVGFGPAIFRFRRGETVYQIGAIPLGGFVRMIGDIPDLITGAQATDDAVRQAEDIAKAPIREKSKQELEDERIAEELFADRSRWFIEKGFWAKSAIVAAGPIFNFIFAFFLATLCGILYGQAVLEEKAILGEVVKDSPGEKAGLKVGDEIKSVDGVAIKQWDEFAQSIRESKGKALSLEIQREGTTINLQATPKEKVIPRASSEPVKLYLLGLSPMMKHQDLSFSESIVFGWSWLYDKTYLTYDGLRQMFTGQASPKDLAGPIFIFQEAGRQVAKGFEFLFFFMAIISVSLAVLNLLPIPVLDGGHLLFFTIEAIVGPISVRKKEFAQQLGMLLLLCLMAFALKNDVTRKEQKESDWNSMGTESPDSSQPQGKVEPQPAGTPAP